MRAEVKLNNTVLSASILSNTVQSLKDVIVVKSYYCPFCREVVLYDSSFGLVGCSHLVGINGEFAVLDSDKNERK